MIREVMWIIIEKSNYHSFDLILFHFRIYSEFMDENEVTDVPYDYLFIEIIFELNIHVIYFVNLQLT